MSKITEEFSMKRRLLYVETSSSMKKKYWKRVLYSWWKPAYHASGKHLMRVIRWRSSTIQILSAKRLDDESHSRFNSSFNDQFRIELDLHAMTSNRDHYFDHYFDHYLRSERSQQTRRQDDWVDDVEAVWRRWNQITVLKDELDWWRSLWVDKSITSNVWDDCLDWMRARMTI
jgi:hypothetical protein